VFYEPQLAAMLQLGEKPRQGFATWKTAWKPSPNVCNSTVAIGLQATVVENGVRETYRARYYNPTTGRFLSEDPLGFKGSGTNLYAYAAWNPISNKDPLGLCTNALSNLSKCAAEGLIAAGAAYNIELAILTVLAMYSAIMLMVEFSALLGVMGVGLLELGLMFLELSAVTLATDLLGKAGIVLILGPIITNFVIKGICNYVE